MPITLVAGGGQALRVAAGGLAPYGVPIITLQADSTDRAAWDAALGQAVGEHGVPEVGVYNTALVRADKLGQLTAHDHLARSREPLVPSNEQGTTAAHDRLWTPRGTATAGLHRHGGP